MADGDIAQLARAPALQAGGPGFESLCLHQLSFCVQRYGVDRVKVRFYSTNHFGRLAQLARASRLHREGRGFEPLSAHHEIIENTPRFGGD
jgi:hypothetical protein